MRLLVSLVLCLGLVLGAGAALGQTLEELVARLPDGSYSDCADIVAAIGATGDDRAGKVLDALQSGDLAVRKADGVVVRVTGRGSRAKAFDPLTGKELGPVPSRSTSAIKVINALRRAVRSALSTLRLAAKDPGRRLAAANEAFRTPDPEQLDAIRAALAVEENTDVWRALEEAAAAALLGSNAGVDERVAAIKVVAGHGGSDALSALT